MKKAVCFIITLMMIGSLSSVLVYADGGGKKHHSKTKHAIHELKEAQTILTKIAPDADGHSLKAAQHIEAAMQELAQIKEAAEKVS